jgi:dipeptide/tripeptide permease
MKKFPPLFWLVIVFEFFERGSYYGVMSILSVYLTDKLLFPKEDVGIIKGTIQPILYFLPILAGALADRFGYRRTLMVAFALLGTGYFLTSQATSYMVVFLFLAVMGLGAGTFKPIISSTIARTTDKENSTMGFGIYYWSINLGAFLFPLILVPWLKGSYGWNTVLIAAAIGTGAMLVPTLLLYREPPRPEVRKQTGLVQTLADAFEIVYSPVVLIFRACRSKRVWTAVAALLFLAFLVFATWSYLAPRKASIAAPGVAFTESGKTIEVRVNRNLSLDHAFSVESLRTPGGEKGLLVEIFHPDSLPQFQEALVKELHEKGAPPSLDAGRMARMVRAASEGPILKLEEGKAAGPKAPPYVIYPHLRERTVEIRVPDPDAYGRYRDALLKTMQEIPELKTLPAATLDTLFSRGRNRPFLLLFIGFLLLAAITLLALEPKYKATEPGSRWPFVLFVLVAAFAFLWGLPDLSTFARIVASVIFVTVLSIYLMDFGDVTRFRDHWRFLLLIFLYSGFWILYFQMFDSVLWYVQAYVDADSLNRAVNGLLQSVGVSLHFRFDVEHVTVINAGTIILLQLIVSSIVKKKRALPTMTVGIALGTLGMAILAISTGIWVFLAGIVIFSVGEMTAHPKFISYVGQTAPRERVATYMGYIFLYGVIGSSIGAVVGARLYVHFVDTLHRPRTLWIVFSLIGVATIAALLLYNKFLAVQKEV